MVKIAQFTLVLLGVLPLAVLAHPGAGTTIDHFSHLIERSPDDQALYMQRGIAYSAAGYYDEALADFDQAKRLGNPSVVNFDLGVLHYRRGELPLAKACLDQYLSQVPGHSGALEYRARVNRDMGDTAGALIDFQNLFKIMPRPNPGYYISAADMLQISGDEGVEQALKLLDDGLQKLGLNPQLQDYAIALEVQRGQYDLAIARQLSMQPMLGHSPDWLVKLAELQLQAGQQQAAMLSLQQADAQIAKLRPTPARMALQQRVVELQQLALATEEPL